MRFCSLDGCKNKHYAKGYCIKHYRIFKNTADEIGVYILTFLGRKEKYIGKTTCSFLERYKNHAQYLAKPNKRNFNDDERVLVDFFDKICPFSRGNVQQRKMFFFNNVKMVPIQGAKIKFAIPLFTPEDSKQRLHEAMELLNCTSGDFFDDQHCIKSIIDDIETSEIQKLLDADKKNGTNYCLNMKKTL